MEIGGLQRQYDRFARTRQTANALYAFDRFYDGSILHVIQCRDRFLEFDQLSTSRGRLRNMSTESSFSHRGDVLNRRQHLRAQILAMRTRPGEPVQFLYE